jgi:hypothetical protein
MLDDDLLISAGDGANTRSRAGRAVARASTTPPSGGSTWPAGRHRSQALGISHQRCNRRGRRELVAEGGRTRRPKVDAVCTFCGRRQRREEAGRRARRLRCDRCAATAERAPAPRGCSFCGRPPRERPGACVKCPRLCGIMEASAAIAAIA